MYYYYYYNYDDDDDNSNNNSYLNYYNCILGGAQRLLPVLLQTVLNVLLLLLQLRRWRRQQQQQLLQLLQQLYSGRHTTTRQIYRSTFDCCPFSCPVKNLSYRTCVKYIIHEPETLFRTWIAYSYSRHGIRNISYRTLKLLRGHGTFLRPHRISHTGHGNILPRTWILSFRTQIPVLLSNTWISRSDRNNLILDTFDPGPWRISSRTSKYHTLDTSLPGHGSSYPRTRETSDTGRGHVSTDRPLEHSNGSRLLGTFSSLVTVYYQDSITIYSAIICYQSISVCSAKQYAQ